MAVVLRRRRRAARPNHDELAHGRRSLCRSPTTSHRTSVEVESGRVQGDRHRRVGRVRHVSGFFEPAVIEASLLFSVVVRRIGSSIWRIQGWRTDVRFSDFRIVLRCTGVGGPGCAHLKGSSERQFCVMQQSPHGEATPRPATCSRPTFGPSASLWMKGWQTDRSRGAAKTPGQSITRPLPKTGEGLILNSVAAVLRVASR